MAVQSDTSRIQYAGNNSTTTSYAVPFVFQENSHLKAIARTSAGVESVVTLTNHTGAGNVNGGTVRTAVAVPATSTLTIYREVPATQTTTYAEGGDFPAASHERALDKLTFIAQQNQRQIGASLRLTESNQISALPLPTAAGQHVLATAGSGTAPSFQSLGSLAIGPVIATGSTAPRSVQDRFADLFNVKDFGAVGNGSTNDVVSVQAAVDAAETAGGGTVFLPAGTYLFNSAPKLSPQAARPVCLLIPSNVTICGSGDATIIKLGSSLPKNVSVLCNKTGDVAAATWTDKNIHIRNLTFDGDALTFPAWDSSTNPATYGGLPVSSVNGQLMRWSCVENVSVENCRIYRWRGLGTFFAGCKDPVFCNNIVEQCAYMPLPSYQAWFSQSITNAVTCIRPIITNNTFKATDYTPIFVGIGTEGGVIANNTLFDSKESAIHLKEAGKGLVVSGNYIDGVHLADISAHGIEAHGISHVSITGNVFRDIDFVGIYINGADNVTVTANTIAEVGNAPATYPFAISSYALGIDGTAIQAFKKSGVACLCSVEKPFDKVALTSNTICDTAATATQEYAVVFGNSGTAANFGDVLISGNYLRKGLTDYFHWFTQAVNGRIWIANNLFREGSTAGYQRNHFEGRTNNFTRNTAAFSSSAIINSDSAQAKNSGGTISTFTEERAQTFTVGGVDNGTWGIWTIVPATTGTATAGTSTSITLASSAAATDHFYINSTINITSGPASGESKTITAYNGATRVATIDGTWTVTPTSSSVYSISERLERRMRVGQGVIVGPVNATNPAERGNGTISARFGYFIDAVSWTSGSGTPEGVVTAPVGSIFTRTNGGAATTLYIKETGTGNTGWAAK